MAMVVHWNVVGSSRGMMSHGLEEEGVHGLLRGYQRISARKRRSGCGVNSGPWKVGVLWVETGQRRERGCAARLD